MYRKIDHVGIAVRSLSEALRIYRAMELDVSSVEEVPAQRTRVAIVPIGDSRVELLESMEADSPVARFISKRGEGIHHICFQVDDIAETLRKLRSAGMRLVDQSPRPGAGGCLVAFVHPQSTGGVLIELSQRTEKDKEQDGKPTWRR